MVGGWDGDASDGSGNLASTELLVVGSAAWREVGALPAALTGLRATTVQNSVYVSGE